MWGNSVQATGGRELLFTRSFQSGSMMTEVSERGGAEDENRMAVGNSNPGGNGNDSHDSEYGL